MQQNKIVNQFQESETYGIHRQWGASDYLGWKSNFEKKRFEIFTERGKTFTRCQCRCKFVPNVACRTESTLAQVQFSPWNRKLLWGRRSELTGDVRKVQETSQIMLLMYCKSAICKNTPSTERHNHSVCQIATEYMDTSFKKNLEAKKVMKAYQHFSFF